MVYHYGLRLINLWPSKVVVIKRVIYIHTSNSEFRKIYQLKTKLSFMSVNWFCKLCIVVYLFQIWLGSFTKHYLRVNYLCILIKIVRKVKNRINIVVMQSSHLRWLPTVLLNYQCYWDKSFFNEYGG